MIIDVQPMIRESLGLLIERETGFQLCNCNTDRVGGVMAAVEEQRPDLLLVDAVLRDGSVLPIIGSLQAKFPHLRTLVLSGFEDISWGHEALNAGAAGYVLKTDGPGEIMAALRSILKGEMYVSRKLASAYFSEFFGVKTSQPTHSEVLTFPTAAELRVFVLMGSGMVNAEIANAMFLSEQSVETHRARLREKLALPDDEALIDYALRCRQDFDRNCEEIDSLLIQEAYELGYGGQPDAPSLPAL